MTGLNINGKRVFTSFVLIKHLPCVLCLAIIEALAVTICNLLFSTNSVRKGGRDRESDTQS